MKLYSVGPSLIPILCGCRSKWVVPSAATLRCLGAVLLPIHPGPGNSDLHQGMSLAFSHANEVQLVLAEKLEKATLVFAGHCFGLQFAHEPSLTDRQYDASASLFIMFTEVTYSLG